MLVVKATEISGTEDEDYNNAQDVCTSFSKGFKSRWGNGAFHKYDKNSKICHVMNVYGAVIPIHVIKVDNYLVTIMGMNIPLANLPDYINDPSFNKTLKKQVLSVERNIPFDFETATAEEKFAVYGPAGNINDAVAVLLSAKIIND